MRIFGRGKKTERVEEPKTFDGDGAEVKDFRRAKKGKGENVPDAAWGKGKEMTLSEAHAYTNVCDLYVKDGTVRVIEVSHK